MVDDDEARAVRIARSRAYNRRPEIKRRNRSLFLMNRYGITIEDYDAMYEAQRGLCALCDKPYENATGQRLHVDHDHATGRIRGLLCLPCNINLERFANDLERTLAYLGRGATESSGG